MFSEILKIVPQVSSSDLRRLERTMTTRFSRVAKSFGKGLANSLKGGGFLGAATVLIDKLMNPLKAVQEAIDSTLDKASSTVSRAQTLGTSGGRLMRLQTFATSKGIDDDALYTMLGKFQNALVEAREKPDEPNVLRQFTGFTDTVEAFNAFTNSLNKQSRDQQLLIQKMVLGEKQSIKADDFIKSLGRGDLEKTFGNLNAATIEKSLTKLDSLKTLDNRLAGVRNWNEIQERGRIINDGMIAQNDSQENIRRRRLNEQIGSYKALMDISKTSDDLVNVANKLLSNVGEFVSFARPGIEKVINFIDKFNGPSLIKKLINSTRSE